MQLDDLEQKLESMLAKHKIDELALMVNDNGISTMPNTLQTSHGPLRVIKSRYVNRDRKFLVYTGPYKNNGAGSAL